MHCYFSPDSLLSLSVLDRLSSWTSVHSPQTPRPISVHSVFLPLTFYPGSSQPLQPHAAILFLPPLPPSVCPPFPTLDIDCSPDELLWWSLLSSVLPPQFPHPPLSALTCGLVSDSTKEGCVSSSWPPVPICLDFSSPAIVPPRLLVSSGGFSSSGPPFTRWQEARESPLLGYCPLQPMSRRYLAVPVPLSLPPPPPNTLFSSWSHPHQSWWSASLECSGKSCCHCRGWLIRKTEVWGGRALNL